MSEVQGSKLDLDGHNDAAALKELVHQGEVCLSDTVRLAIAADSRATTFCGIFGAGGVALLAAAAANFASQHGERAFITAAVVAGLLFIFASAVAAFAARPTDFFAGGDEPRRIATVTDALAQLRYIAIDLQMRIDKNRTALERSAARTLRALYLAGTAVLGGAIGTPELSGLDRAFPLIGSVLGRLRFDRVNSKLDKRASGCRPRAYLILRSGQLIAPS
jgi:hypothetical protein